MNTRSETNLAVAEALGVLKEYSCIQIKAIESEAEKERLRQALLLITSLSEYENLGICADNPQQGFAVLSSYLRALGYQTIAEEATEADGRDPVYIKFSTKKMSHYLAPYTGSYRGVLISCQSEDDNLTGTYGHFPLNLFN